MEFINEIISLLDNVEIESSIHLKKNNKTIKIIDHRIVCDNKTSKTYLVFRIPGDDKYTKINLNNILDFINDGIISALPGDDEIEKLHFVTSYLKSIPKLDSKKATTEPNINKSKLSSEVKTIILSDEDIIDKIKKLINIKDGKDFIIKMANGKLDVNNLNNDKIIESLGRLLNTSIGQKCIRQMASKYMNQIEEELKSFD